MKYKKTKIISLFFCFAIFTIIFHFYSKTNKARDGLIVAIPIEAFDNQGNLIDKNWQKYLQKRKPVGVIFFNEHFQNKEIGKKIVSEVKSTINDNVILAADEEGGRINRFSWLDVKSAEEIGEEYKNIKNKYGYQKAREFVKQQYIPMFQAMKELGLNMTFAPNLDLNKYVNLKKDTDEYKNYKKCEEYIKNSRKTKKSIQKENIKNYKNSLYFLAYLDEIGVRKINLKFINNKKEITTAKQEWHNIDIKQKNNLIAKFKPLVKYANYASVVGNRSFGSDIKIVGEIAEIFVDTAKKFGITCVAKHALGHGRVDKDTHLEKTHSKSSIDEIIYDMTPYIHIKDKINFVMPSHVTYDVIDNENSAVNSKKVLNFTRKIMNNNVMFISDDISMEAADDNIKSPCDIVIVSHKTLNEIKQIGGKYSITQAKNKEIFKNIVK